MNKLEIIFELIINIVFFVIIMGFLLLFGSVIGAMAGVMLESLFGHWMFWPGFVIGEIIFIMYIWDKFNNCGPSHNERYVSPFVLNRRVKLAKRLLKK